MKNAVTKIRSSRTGLWICSAIVLSNLILLIGIHVVDRQKGAFTFGNGTFLLSLLIVGSISLTHYATDAIVTADGKVFLTLSKIYKSIQWSGRANDVQAVHVETVNMGEGDETHVSLLIDGIGPLRMQWDRDRAEQFAQSIGKSLLEKKPEVLSETLTWSEMKEKLSRAS